MFANEALDVVDIEAPGTEHDELCGKILRRQRLHDGRHQRRIVTCVEKITVTEHHQTDAFRSRRFESGQPRPCRRPEPFDRSMQLRTVDGRWQLFPLKMRETVAVLT